MKDQVIARVDALGGELIQLSHDIHAHPEVAYTEYQSSALIADLLRKHGFAVELPYGGLETAFRAVKQGKPGGPHLAFLAEYDSLPEIGHACGHNVIAACSTGAFLALASVMEHYAGTVSIIGTPAEEAGGGKIQLLQNGAFDGVEYALMMHPSSGKKGLVNRGGRAATSVTVEFFGKAAHSANPANGINALNALIATFNNIDLMRPTLHFQSNINGIITKGGTAANAIPDYACAQFSLRALTLIELERLAVAVERCAMAAQNLTGATAKVTVGSMYAERYPNLPMCTAFKTNMEALGMEMEFANPTGIYGSSDIGNVSIHIPSIHDYLPLCDDGINSHNVEYTQQTDKPRADTVCLLGAKGLAMTAIDILQNADLRREIQDYFAQQIPKEYHTHV